MRLILFDRLTEKRHHFSPAALGRPIFELRCGIGTLAEKWLSRQNVRDAAFFVPPYMADAYRQTTDRPVNDHTWFHGDDLLVVDARVKVPEFTLPTVGPSLVFEDTDGEILGVRIAKEDIGKLKTDSLDDLLDSARKTLPVAEEPAATWNYLWDLIAANPAQLTADFAAAGRSGIEGTTEEPVVIRGSRKDVFVARDAVVHPMTVLDAERGPIYIDEGAIVHPFTRIEGPCYIGKHSILFGCKCREGNSIGPMCRLGGEVEASIIQGYSNKYHDGFLGHAYVGQWVNLGAMTTNSDLKNDYSEVSVVLDGRTAISTGLNKIGSLIGDHVKTSIGTLLNTGAYVGPMAMIVTDGQLLPKHIPPFGCYVRGKITEAFGRERLYAAARSAMSRRGCEWTAADEALWNDVYEKSRTPSG